MFTKNLEITLNIAFTRAKNNQYEILTVEHLLLALLDNPEVIDVLIACGFIIDSPRRDDIQDLRDDLQIFIDETIPRIALHEQISKETQPTLGFQRVLQRAIFQVQAAGRTEVTGANVLAAMFNEQESQAVFYLNQKNITRLDVINYLAHGAPKSPDSLSNSNTDTDNFFDPNRTKATQGFQEAPVEDENMIERYAVNLMEEVRLGKIDPLIGRQEELLRTVQVLCRRRKNNPLFVGDPGVGKTAIAEGLAILISEGKVPQALINSIIYTLDLGMLLAGTKYRGDFEKRFKALLSELKKTPNIIIFIDEIHTLVGAGAASGGALDAANLLKPLLGAGELRCMGATTYQEYRTLFSKDKALSRRFQKIDICQPTIPETVKILHGLKERFENFHGVKYTSTALKTAAELSARYLTDRCLPDSAIDVIDEVGALQCIKPLGQRHKIISPRDIEEVVARLARIPAKQVSASDKQALQHLEEDLKALVYGQDKAIGVLCSAIKLARSGLRDPVKPVGSFLFTGPTGVGKTEVTQQLAKVMGIPLIRFDMSEYMERHAVARLIGAPPGYIGYDKGGLLTESVNKQPYAILLLDEIEKAHPDTFNLLLQVMDYGSLTDNNGVTADFRHIILIMTSNAGTDQLSKMSMGFTRQDNQDNNSGFIEELNHLFSPEFRNRLDAIIQFRSLDTEIIKRVTDKFIGQLEKQLENQGIGLSISSAAKSWLAENGYDQKMGARPMARLIEQQIKRPLADEILFGKLMRGGQAHIVTRGKEIVVEVNS